MGLLEDARNIQRKDPAARSVLEVMLLYPGFHILVYHRIAHWLYQHKHFFLARWVSQHGRHRTGIEIHPGATIGKCLFIDHGMGTAARAGSDFHKNFTNRSRRGKETPLRLFFDRRANVMIDSAPEKVVR